MPGPGIRYWLENLLAFWPQSLVPVSPADRSGATTGLLHHEHVSRLLDHPCDVTLLFGVQSRDLAGENLSGVGHVAAEQMNVLEVHLLRSQALPFWRVACFGHGEKGKRIDLFPSGCQPSRGCGHFQVVLAEACSALNVFASPGPFGSGSLEATL